MYVKYLKIISSGLAWTRDPKIEKKIIPPISLNIAHFYFYRIDGEKLLEIDPLIIKIRCKMADLWHFKIFLFKHEASRSCAMHKVNV